MRTTRPCKKLNAVLGLVGAMLACGAAWWDPDASAGGAEGGQAAEPAATDGLVASPEPGWPQWRGPRRDGISQEKGLLSSWPEGGPKLVWKVDHLGQGWSSPIVVGKRIYITGDVGDELVVWALDLDGRPLWRSTNGQAWHGQYPGARATCVYSEGRVYHMNAHGRVACLDGASGRELWAVDVLERFQGRNITWAMSECLLVDGDRLIVTPGGRKALVAALEKNSGQTVWATEPPNQDSATYSSPILFRFAGRRILANCSSGHGFGVDADTGKLLWNVPLKNQYDVNASTPVYGFGQVHYATAYFIGACYRLTADNGTVQAEPAWSTPLDCVTTSPILVGNLLYASGYRKPKYWIALDWTTGQIRAEQKNLTTGAAVYADGRLYCLAEDGRAALLTPAADGFHIAGQFQLVSKRVRDAWAHPVLCDGRLFLRYHDTLWCYDVRGR